MQDRLLKQFCILPNCIKEVLDIIYRGNLYVSKAKITFIVNNSFLYKTWQNTLLIKSNIILNRLSFKQNSIAYIN